MGWDRSEQRLLSAQRNILEDTRGHHANPLHETVKVLVLHSFMTHVKHTHIGEIGKFYNLPERKWDRN